MCDGEQSNAAIFSCLINLTLHINANSAGTFIQQHKVRLVIEETRHSYSLLLTTR